MNARLIVAALVALSVLPMAAATAPQHASTGDPVAPQVAGTDATNYTKLYVDGDGGYLDLKPGESDSFTVSVKNAEDHAVEVNPHVFTSPTAENPLPSEWVTIDGPTDIGAGEEVDYDVSVDVPDGADTARYYGSVAFTNETTTYPGRPPQPIHAERVSVEVWQEPTVRILSDTYLNTRVKAGETVTRQITIENTGDSAVPLSPELAKRNGRCYGNCPAQLDPSWIDVDAPSQIAPGETATVTITIAPPADADVGDYRTEVNLGLKDPNRPERNDYWQQVDVSFLVWEEPDQPYEASFGVSEGTENVTLTLSAGNSYRDDGDSEPPAFTVEFVSPDGEVIEATRVRRTNSGYVSLVSRSREGTTQQGDYTARGQSERFTYELDAPAAGEWTVRITPENVVNFQYQITRNENGEN